MIIIMKYARYGDRKLIALFAPLPCCYFHPLPLLEEE
jgi:hypothetical protein